MRVLGKPRRMPARSDAQQMLLDVLGAYGLMEAHALIWKSGLPERRAVHALDRLFVYGEVELVRDHFVGLTDAGRRSER